MISYPSDPKLQANSRQIRWLIRKTKHADDPLRCYSLVVDFIEGSL